MKGYARSAGWPKAIKRAYKASLREGWTWDLKGNGHWSVFDPDGNFVVSMSATFYDGPLTNKYLGKLRKAGCPGT